MPPIVVDAGALDLLPCHVVPQVVITPHAGELAALLNRLDADMADVVSRQWVEARPLRAALRAHEAYRGHGVLLKGAVTIVVGADGDGNRGSSPVRARAWIATAGSGAMCWPACWARLLAQQDDMLSDDPALVPEIAAAATCIWACRRDGQRVGAARMASPASVRACGQDSGERDRASDCCR